jgi:hypothetical protein
MIGAAAGAIVPSECFVTPVIEWGVVGPHQQTGFLLRAPRLETLAWDLENEVTSVRRAWVEHHSAWWVATSYFETVLHIVFRAFPSVLVIHGPDGDRLYSRDGQVVAQERLL